MNATKVGLFTLIVLIVLAGIITWKSDIFLTRGGYEITGSFKNIEGLTTGSDVRYRGFSIGKITRIDPGPLDIKVYAIVKGDIDIPIDSKLRVGFDGIVGQKYLEINPGTSEALYRKGILQGISTAGIVDFVDIGAQNLVETKRILIALRNIVEDPAIQMAFKNAVLTADKAAQNIDQLVQELRMTNSGIKKITTDPQFQESVKGTVNETNKTLSSANKFFDSFGKLNIKTSGDIQYGSANNSIRGNIDIVQNPEDYVRVGIGEGPTRNISLLDLQISRKMFANTAMRLGMINTFLGGGLDYFMSDKMTISGDLYDFNNPKPNVPKVRTTARYKFYDYTDFFVQADDMFNPQRNYSVGITVKGTKD